MLRLLGPVTLETPAGPVARGGPKERAVLALLAVNRNRVVSSDALADVLWGDDPPRTAAKTLATYMSRVRRGLSDTGVEIERMSPGFLLRVAVDDVDADLAARDAGAARAQAALDPAGAAERLGELLEMWRAPSLAEFAHEPFARAEAIRLDELRSAIEEDRLVALLESGEQPVAEAERLVGDQPLREKRWELLVLSLYRSGRQADALRAFQRARAILVEELGLEPGESLCSLERAVIAQDPALSGVVPAAVEPDNDYPFPTSGGPVTFLLTDVEGSTQRWERDAAEMGELLAAHDRMTAETVEAEGGRLVKSKGEGDSTFSVFADPVAAVRAAHRLQVDLPLPVRMAIHHGDAELRAGDWFGTTVNRAARVRSVAHGRQVVISDRAAALAGPALPEGCELRDLGTHRLKDLNGPERIWQLCSTDLPSDFPPLNSLTADLTNLPAELNRFVGRGAELDQVSDLIRESRLVTLTGPGGSGKTRLAMQAGNRSIGSFTDGVWLVELAPVGAEQVPDAVAAALRIVVPPGREPLEAVIESLEGLDLLVVLDNCEHVVAAAADVVDRLLAQCPRLRIVATSRERLAITGEAIWPVLPLNVPDSDDDRGAESVRLFADRARAVHPAFEVTDVNMPAVATICRRLDGIPLAIELAAARTRLLSPDEIALRLDDRFALLTGGARTARPRQQTLRALVDWSYDLLDHGEQALFRRLAVFRGGFTLAAADAVGGDGSPVFELVDRLVDKSLLVLAEGGRFSMLETLREYGLDQLAPEEATAVRMAHASWVERTVADGSFRDGTGQAEALATMRAEHDNVGAALAWSCTEGSAMTAARIAANCWRLWYIGGLMHGGAVWTAQALEASADEHLPPGLRAEMLCGAAWLGHLSKTRDDATTILLEAIDLAEGSGELRVASMAHALRGEIIRQNDPDADLTPMFERALELATEAGAVQESGIARMFLSFTIADIGRRNAILREALADAETARDRWSVGAIAQLLAWDSDAEEGDRLRGIAMEAARDLGDRRTLAATLRQEAVIRAGRGERERAREVAYEALEASRASGDMANRGGHLWECGIALEAVGERIAARAILEESLSLVPLGLEAAGEPACLVMLAYIDRDEGDSSAALARLDRAFELAIGGPNPFVLGIAARLAATLAASAGDRGVVAAVLDGIDAAIARGDWWVLPEDVHDADDRRRITDQLGALPERRPGDHHDNDTVLHLVHRWVRSRVAITSPGGVEPAGAAG